MLVQCFGITSVHFYKAAFISSLLRFTGKYKYMTSEVHSLLTRTAQPVPRRLNSSAGTEMEHFVIPTSELWALKVLIEKLSWKTLIL